MDTMYETIKIKMKVCEGPRATIRDPESILSLLREIRKSLDDSQEHFIMLALDRGNRVIGFKVLFSGGSYQTVVDIAVLYRNALLMGATALIIAHNHPSGRTEPSLEDRAITVKIVSAGNLFGITILDHIILADGSEDYLSFRERNLL